MKKILLFAAMAAFAFAACDKNNGEDDGSTAAVLEATFDLTSELGDLTYGEPVTVTGTLTSASPIDGVSFTGVNDEGTAVGEVQRYEAAGTEINGQFFPDTKDMTQLQVTLYSGNAQASFNFPVGTVTGEAKGDVYINNTAQFMADTLVYTHENNPELFPTENTGNGSDTKSFFSMHGVKIDGQVEHILSLNQLRAVDGQNASFCFANALMNTRNNVYFGSERGPVFISAVPSRLTAGTIGRYCDIYEVDGHAIKAENVDSKFVMELVRGSWAVENYDEEYYTAIDRIFLNIGEANTNYEKLKAFWQLGEIQRTYDNATLGEENDPTSIGDEDMYRMYLRAGTSVAGDASENFRAGDYIIIRSQRGTTENPVYYYGIMQIRQLPDVSVAFDANGDFDQEKAHELYLKPCYLDIKTQCEILD